MTDEGYEAMVLTANLPLRTITFVYRDGGPRLCGGIFRIERVRNVTDEDKRAFPGPPDDVCPNCGRPDAA